MAGNDRLHDNLALGIDGPDVPQSAAVLEIHDRQGLRPVNPVSDLSGGNVRISLRPSFARHNPGNQGNAGEAQRTHCTCRLMSIWII